MFKRFVPYTRRAMFVLPVVVVLLLLLAASTQTIASAPAAPTTFYQCTPDTVAAFTNRVHVHCTVPYVAPGPANIYWFAFCTSPDSVTASRMLSVFTAAKATGKNVGVYFTPTDTSGTACGCGSNDCRVVDGAEIRP